MSHGASLQPPWQDGIERLGSHHCILIGSASFYFIDSIQSVWTVLYGQELARESSGRCIKLCKPAYRFQSPAGTTTVLGVVSFTCLFVETLFCPAHWPMSGFLCTTCNPIICLMLRLGVYFMEPEAWQLSYENFARLSLLLFSCREIIPSIASLPLLS